MNMENIIRSRGAITKIQAIVIAIVIIVAIIGSVAYYYITLPSPPEELVIGASLPLTGALAEEGGYFKRGYEMAIQDYNTKGGVLGMKIKLIIEDDKSDPSTTTTIYEKLITAKGAKVLLGPVGSSCTFAAAAVAEKHGIVIVSSYAASENLYTQGWKYHFGVIACPLFSASWSAPFLYFLANFSKWAPPGAPEVKTLAIIGLNNPFGKDAVEKDLKIADELGFKVVLSEYYDPEITDFTPLLTKIKAANPDALIAVNYYHDSLLLARQIAELRISFKAVWMGTGPDMPVWIKELGPLAENYFGCVTWPETWTYGGAEEFRTNFKAKYGETPNLYDAWAYGAVQVLIEAIKRAGSLDSDKIREVLLNQEIVTVHCKAKFAPEGYNILYYGSMIGQVQNGKLVSIWPPEIKEAEPIYPMSSSG
jgi:branched-chain amino acid transport system substrate-binding protein